MEKKDTLEQCEELQPVGMPTLEKFMKDCLRWVAPHARTAQEHEEEEKAETKCYELMATPIPCPPVLL